MIQHDSAARIALPCSIESHTVSPVSLSCHLSTPMLRLVCATVGEHADVRWNPDLGEWFCAKCGQTSDHKEKDDAIRELENFDCSIHGTSVAKLGEKERLLRAHYLNKLRKPEE